MMTTSRVTILLLMNQLTDSVDISHRKAPTLIRQISPRLVGFPLATMSTSFIQLVDKPLRHQLIDVAVIDVGLKIEFARFLDGRKLLRCFDHFRSDPRYRREQRHKNLVSVGVPFFVGHPGIFW